MAIDPGYRRSSPPSVSTPSSPARAYQFVELNAETPAGARLRGGARPRSSWTLPVVKAFPGALAAAPVPGGSACSRPCSAATARRAAASRAPVIAIVDYEEVPTRVEHHLFREFFESRGYPSLVCDPRQLEYESGRLRHEGLAIDIVYKRLLVNEFLERASELQALLQAVARARGRHGQPVPLQADPQEGHLRGPDRRRAAGPVHRRRAEAAIAPTYPGPAAWARARTRHYGEAVDLPAFVRANRDRLVMKPNDEYGGKGVFLGWEMAMPTGKPLSPRPSGVLRGAGEGGPAAPGASRRSCRA